MNLSVIHDTSISNLINITWNKVTQIQEIPAIFKKDKIAYIFSQFNVPKESARNLKNDTIIQLNDRLGALKNDLDKYNPGIIRKIIDFFTGRFFTHYRLRNSLPQIIYFVDNVAKAIIAKKATKEAAQAKKAAAEEAAQAKKAADEKNKPRVMEKQKLQLQAIVYPEALEDEYESGDAIRVNESQLKITPEEMAYKTNLVRRAKNYCDILIEQYTHPDEAKPLYSLQTAEKIQKYMGTLLNRLNKGINVTLGQWYHATGRGSDQQAWENVDKIIKSKTIMQLPAPRGYGAYLSSCDEYEAGYGLITFVLDQVAISKKVLGNHREVHYFPGDPIYYTHGKDKDKQNRYGSLWLRIRNQNPATAGQNMIPCIPVNTDTIAFMATHTKHVAALREKLKTMKFKVSVLDREEVDFIRKIFDFVETQRPPSKHDLEKDSREKQGIEPQSMIVKYRDRTGKLLHVGGRHIPLDWQPHELRENFHSPGFPRQMKQLKWLVDSGAELEASFAPI